MIRTQAYDVNIDVKDMNIMEEHGREYIDEQKVKISTKVHVLDTTDTRDAVENKPDGKINPYGLDTDTGAYDVEVRERMSDAEIQERIDAATQDEMSNNDA